MRHLRRRATSLAAVALVSVVLSACQMSDSSEDDGPQRSDDEPGQGPTDAQTEPSAENEPGNPVTLAFAGDVHFEGGLIGLPGQGGSTLGPMSEALGSADLAMVNLESALTTRGAPAEKELEDPSQRFWFRSPPSALGVLERSGVDVVTVANNHGGDYGAIGIRDAARLGREGPVSVVGVGRDHTEAYTPHVASIRGTEVAVLAADASPRESVDPIWEVRPGSGPGMAAARTPASPQLLQAVRRADRRNDVVVVYLHWGEELSGCPTRLQRALAANLEQAGADVIVGTHAHVPLGAGRLGTAYVSYGLGNFLWYPGRSPDSGVLRLRVDGDGEVLREEWRPAEIPIDGGAPEPLTGAARTQAMQEWRDLRGCTDLRPGPGTGGGERAQQPREAEQPEQPEQPESPAPQALPAFESTVRPIGAALRRSMTSHDPAVCPTPLSDLRHLTVSYVDFDGAAQRGRIIVNAEVARDVVSVFERLYEVRYPISQMRLIDDFDGDDNASMAANNTSGYNCRRVAGSESWSDHAYGRAIDLNPVQNPYVTGGDVLPPAGGRFVDVDRSEGARAARAVITEGDAVTRVFDRLGWEWGGRWTEPDYQHFNTA